MKHFVFPQFTSLHSVFHSFHGLINSINWPASSVWVFIAQLGEHCSANAEATGSNPVEAPKVFFSGYFRNCLNCDSLRWSHTHFICIPAVHIITFRENENIFCFSLHPSPEGFVQDSDFGISCISPEKRSPEASVGIFLEYPARRSNIFHPTSCWMRRLNDQTLFVIQNVG